jgi:hypothetical protein
MVIPVFIYGDWRAVVARNLRVGSFYKELQMHNRKAFFSLMSGILILFFACQVGSLMAVDPAEEKSQEMARTETSARNDAATGAPSDPSPAAIANELNEMREMINLQRKQIEKLQSMMEQQQKELNKAMSAIAAKPALAMVSAERPASAASPAPASYSSQDKVEDVELVKGELEAVADSAAQANQRLSKLETDTAANKKETDAKGKQLGNFNFSGDIRARVETFLQDGAETRTRERFRLRFNVTGKVSDEFSGGFSLATGSLDDPVSTNQSLTGFFNRKSFGVDKAYVTYKPKYASFLKLDAGRFAFPWYRTPMTFDSDVNVEGLAQTLSFDLKSSIFKNFTIVSFQLPINEVSGDDDGYLLGGQIQAKFKLGSKVNLGLYGAGIDILRADPIAVAVGGSLRPSLPNTNTLRRSSSGSVIGYANGYAYLDAIMKLDFDTGVRFPTSLLFNFVNNVRGSHERSGYWTELMFGKTSAAKDVQFGYAFIRIEKDAVIGAWNESDMRASTNVLNHRLSFAYMIKGNVTGQFTGWIGKLANPYDNRDLAAGSDMVRCTGSDQSGCRDNYLKRLQFDLIYRY